MSRRGRPFPCRACGSSLVISKAAVGIAVAITAVLIAVARLIPMWTLIPLFVAMALIEWLLVPVRLADELRRPPESPGG
ncbi:hypothetical protein [Allosphingosinicella sp.]|jgi:hypothetical protein|uniref:hypothetical protein n=1 Tax=Allosphingosinicella sp. TaxID=2823234 RepID=UPI002F0CF862